MGTNAARSVGSVAKSVGLLAPPSDGLITTGAAPTFSVIVAAYNVADLITEALASIREQSVAPLEVIVCDDGSTDGLEGALKPYREEIVFLRGQLDTVPPVVAFRNHHFNAITSWAVDGRGKVSHAYA